MYQKLLFPTDGSELSKLALPHVAAIARAMGATVFVVQAVEIVTEADAMTVPERRTEADQSVAEVVAALEAEGVPVASARVVEGDAGRSIVDAASEDGVDLVVMATHGRSGLLRIALGSVAAYVMTHVSCPILLVRPPREE